MRLIYQLLLGFMACLIPVFGLMLVEEAYDLRQAQERILGITAQDTATSLGLSLSPHLPEDLAMADTMMNAIYDSGFYSEIILTDVDGNLMLERKKPVVVDGVPQWLVSLFRLDPPAGVSEINDGWQRIAILSVKSHPGVGYRYLWDGMIDKAAAFLLAIVLLIGLSWLLLRVILTPLHAIESQARAISNRNFITVDKIPRTPELAHVVNALNKMALTLSRLFQQLASRAEQLREETYLDEQTQLGNVLQFRAQFQEMLQNPEGPGFGYTVVCELASYHQIVKQEGNEAADKDLQAIAELLRDVCKHSPGARLYRFMPDRFAILLPYADRPEVAEFITTLSERLTAHQAPMHSEGVAWLAGAPFRHGDEITEIRNNIDAALDSARREKPNGYFLPQAGEPVLSGLEHQKEALAALLHVDQMQLFRQPIIAAKNNAVWGYEILPRFRNKAGNLIPTGQVVAMAENLRQIELLDKLVIKEGLKRLTREARGQHIYSLNVSIQSTQSPEFLQWLKATLATFGGLLPNIKLDLHESGLLQDLAHGERFISEMRDLGVQCSIDHFGVNISSFGILKQLRPAAVKVDGSYVRNINEEPGNETFLRVLIQLAHGLDMQVVGMQVEQDAEWQLMKQLDIDYGQGYGLGEPEPFN